VKVIPTLMGTCVETSWSKETGRARVTLEFYDVREDTAFPIVAGQEAMLIGMGPVLRAAERTPPT